VDWKEELLMVKGDLVMALIPWRTKREEDGGRQLAPLSGFRHEMDRLFDSFFRDSLSTGDRPWGGSSAWGPPLDVEETDKEIMVKAEIPGMKAEDLELSIRGDALVISGEKKESQERRDKGYAYQERRFGSFRREVPLPAAVDPDDVNAEYKDGVLTVRLQKSQEALPKKIQVKTS
jgi:HSP20 family protein